MVTSQELFCAILVPLVVAVIIAGVGWWQKWTWTMPAAAGAGFLAGYALLGVPKLPPRDGTDWLFWLAIPLTCLGIADAATNRRWGWLLGSAAGAVALLIVWPLVPGAVSLVELGGTALALATVGAAIAFACRYAETHIGSLAVVGGLCFVLGGAALAVFSSNLRIVGLYGMAASAALGSVAVLSGKLDAARGVAIVSVGLLAGLLVSGRYYPDPGLSWVNFVVLMASPALLLLGAALPDKLVGKKIWIRGVAGVLAVAVAVAAVSLPAALAAKKAAEADPYEAYY